MSQSRVFAEINLNHITSNLECLHALVQPDTKLVAVIKANGYGHGAIAIAKHVEALPYLQGFAVASCEEAMELRTAGIAKPILILGYTFSEDYKTLIENEISMVVFKEETAKELNDIAGTLGRRARIHLVADTGMSRIGVRTDQSGGLTARAICAYPNLITEGIMTHFATADETDKAEALRQYRDFLAFVSKLKEDGITFTYRHCSNSAAIMELPETNLNLVRCGIAIYGMLPSSEVRKDLPLSAAMSIKSKIVYLKELPKGCRISYGGTYITTAPTRVATIPVGYADGYPRSLSNKGYVLIGGQRAPILGRVCMDQMMVDVTAIPEANEYDEVVLLGRQGTEVITAELLGEMSGRFNYELVCDINERVPRVYLA